ncbi:MAG: TetR family transcriptional regulator [candidate division KSB1 bacterium]|nr:TetR family transcriptional regulator [candidate division KSB1 bacterium]MDZ7295407.1 TetR family transcriptional regulator [candidate division KSB1 bacterium]MDZ7379996.1 TetR family transcriptional regulator [candidate division KSB1 bacterium]MDZ7384583.1 TetR family transcriptional regulator [candidate division KSB1 bacterium]MDZ7392927.1 TetR family transcriptional regulator [candidate division KSB1 bacterium]
MGEDKRERIMKSAMRMFAKKGFFHTKVSEIARGAGVADGTTYLYFRSKDDILISLFESEMEPILAHVRRELAKETSATSKLRRFASLHFQMVEKNQDLAMVIVVELRQSAKFMHEYPGTKFKEYLDVIAGIVEEGQQSGEFRADVHPSIAKQAIFGALDGLATNWILSKRTKRGLSDLADQVADLFVQGLVAHPH